MVCHEDVSGAVEDSYFPNDLDRGYKWLWLMWRLSHLSNCYMRR